MAGLVLEVYPPFAQDASVDYDELKRFMPELTQLGFRFLHGAGNNRRATAGHTDLLHHITDGPIVTDNKHGQWLFSHASGLCSSVPYPDAFTKLGTEQKWCQNLCLNPPFCYRLLPPSLPIYRGVQHKNGNR